MKLRIGNLVNGKPKGDILNGNVVDIQLPSKSHCACITCGKVGLYDVMKKDVVNHIDHIFVFSDGDNQISIVKNIK